METRGTSDHPVLPEQKQIRGESEDPELGKNSESSAGLPGEPLVKAMRVNELDQEVEALCGSMRRMSPTASDSPDFVDDQDTQSSKPQQGIRPPSVKTPTIPPVVVPEPVLFYLAGKQFLLASLGRNETEQEAVQRVEGILPPDTTSIMYHPIVNPCSTWAPVDEATFPFQHTLNLMSAIGARPNELWNAKYNTVYDDNFISSPPRCARMHLESSLLKDKYWSSIPPFPIKDKPHFCYDQLAVKSPAEQDLRVNDWPLMAFHSTFHEEPYIRQWDVKKGPQVQERQVYVKPSPRWTVPFKVEPLMCLRDEVLPIQFTEDDRPQVCKERDIEDCRTLPFRHYERDPTWLQRPVGRVHLPQEFFDWAHCTIDLDNLGNAFYQTMPFHEKGLGRIMIRRRHAPFCECRNCPGRHNQPRHTPPCVDILLRTPNSVPQDKRACVREWADLAHNCLAVRDEWRMEASRLAVKVSQAHKSRQRLVFTEHWLEAIHNARCAGTLHWTAHLSLHVLRQQADAPVFNWLLFSADASNEAIRYDKIRMCLAFDLMTANNWSTLHPGLLPLLVAKDLSVVEIDPDFCHGAPTTSETDAPKIRYSQYLTRFETPAGQETYVARAYRGCDAQGHTDQQLEVAESTPFDPTHGFVFPECPF